MKILNIETTLNDDPTLEGVGLSIFCSGCKARCKDCHNPDSWSPYNGTTMTVDEIKNRILQSKELIKSVCFCGGEFLLYPSELYELSLFAKKQKLKTILYTGYNYEDVVSGILENLDIVIDGKFRSDLKTLTFPASSNQRVFINGIQLTDQQILELPINQRR